MKVISYTGSFSTFWKQNKAKDVCLKIWKGKYSRFVLLKNFIAIHRSLFFDVNLRITAIL